MTALEGFLIPGVWRITRTDNEQYWPVDHIVTISSNPEGTFDLHWTDCKDHRLSLRGIPVADGIVGGVAVAEAEEAHVEGVDEKLWQVTLDMPSPGKLAATVLQEPSSANTNARVHHLDAVWGADAGG